LALVLALTGSAFAVTAATKNSVTSKSIKNGTITGKDVKDGRLTGGDIDESSLDIPAQALGPNTVGGQEVKDDSLTGSDVDESSLNLPPAPEPGLGVYSSKTIGDFGIVAGGDGYVPVTGVSSLNATTPGPLEVASPNVDLVASDLYVEEVLPSSNSVPVTAQVLADGNPVISCVLPQVAGAQTISCNSGAQTGSIPAGSRIVIRFRVGAGSELVRSPLVSFAVRPA
jgi:hypothetical protein